MQRRFTATVVVCALFLAFGGPSFAGDGEARAEAAIAAAIAHEGRTEDDLNRDKSSKPAEILAFAGVRPGMKVVDLFSAGGYYSELLSYLVGPEGRVYAHNNAAYLKFVGKQVEARYRDNRLVNVVHWQKEVGDLELPEAGLDGAFLVMAYHDFYYQTEGWPLIDSQKLLGQVHRALKPGGFLLVIDHAAKTGTGKDHAQDLHRIDEAFAKADILEAGFRLAAENQALRRADDDRTKLVFDPDIRRKTDRFVHLYRK